MENTPNSPHDPVKLQTPKGEFGNRFKEAMERSAKEAEQKAAKSSKKAEAPAAAPAAPKPAEPAAAPTGVPDLKVESAPLVPKLEKPAAEAPVTEEPKKGSKEYNFKELSKAKDDIERKLTESQTKMAEMEKQLQKFAAIPAPEEIEKTKKQLSEYETLVNRFYLEHDPKFKASFDAKIEKVVGKAKKAVGEENAERVEQILRMPDGPLRDEQLRQLTSDLDDELGRTRLIQAIDDYSEVIDQRNGELAKAGENLKALKNFDEVKSAEQKKQIMAERLTVMEQIVANAAKQFEEFQPAEGNEAHNAMVKENLAYVKNWMSEDLTHADQAKLAVWAVKGIRSANKEAALTAMVSKLQEQIKDMTAVQPRIDASGGGTKKAAPPTIEDISNKFRTAIREGVPQRGE